ncbi:MAG: hypothetical protein Q8Q09_13345 [Deltaproteobacteria bacterium]|nr:hypothetical protein [Deltaproteobacteria bacterium]
MSYVTKFHHFVSLSGVAMTLALGLAATNAHALDICYTGGTSVPGFQANGSASLSAQGLEITPDRTTQRGSLLSTSTFAPSQNLRVYFRVDISSAMNSGADGLAFVMTSATGGAGAIGTSGQGIGYGGLTPSVVVEFDTFTNSGDPAFPHIGLTFDGDPATHVGGAVDMRPLLTTTSPVAGAFNVWVEYTAASNRLEVFASRNSTRPGVALLTSTVNLAARLGASFRAGFTGSTGGLSSRHLLPAFVMTDGALVDSDGDGVVDQCDADADNDCLPNALDSSPLDPMLPAGAHCTNAGAPLCAVLSTAPTVGTCVACTAADNTRCGALVCDVPTGNCQGCTPLGMASPQCPMPRPLCSLAGRCAECLTSASCSGARPVCDTVSGSCVRCLLDSQCTGSTNICDTVTRTCVECRSNLDCSGSMPICDSATQRCRNCATATQATDCPLPTAPFCQTTGAMNGRCVAVLVTLTTPTEAERTRLAPTLTGTAPPGSVVSVRVDGVEIGRATADASGVWTLTAPMSLTPGPRVATAAVVLSGTTLSPFSPARNFVVVAPPVVINPPDTSSTTNLRPAITGTALANGTVVVFIDGVQVGTAMTNATGAWSYTPTTDLALGMHTVDAAWREGTAVFDRGNSHTFVVGVAVVVVTPRDASRISNRRPVLSGTAAPNALVAVFVDGVEVGRATANAMGTWTLMLSMDLALGSHQVLGATVMGGVVGARGASNSFVIEQVPTVDSPSENAVIVDRMAPLRGTGAPNVSVVITVNGVELGRTMTDAMGQWTLVPPTSLPLGENRVVATEVAAAMMTPTPSATRTFDVVISPEITRPINGSTVDTRQPMISGTAAPNSTVVVYFNGVEVARVMADAMGRWVYTPMSEVPGARLAISVAPAVGTRVGPQGMAVTVGLPVVRLDAGVDVSEADVVMVEDVVAVDSTPDVQSVPDSASDVSEATDAAMDVAADTRLEGTFRGDGACACRTAGTGGSRGSRGAGGAASLWLVGAAVGIAARSRRRRR